jgi:hypothetical protein
MTGRRVAAPRITLKPPRIRVIPPVVSASAITGATLAVLALAATSSTIGAIASLGATVLLLAVVSFGLRQTAEGIIYLGVLLVPMNDLHTSGAASFVTAADALFVLGFTLMMPELLRRQIQLPPAFVLGAGGVLMIALMSSMLSEDPAASFNVTARLLVGAFGLSVLVAWWNPSMKKVVTIAWAYVLGNVVSVGYGVVGGPRLGDGRLFGFTEHPNIFGLCSLLGLAVVPFLVAMTPRPNRWLPVAAGLVCFYGIWSSGSRGALATAIAVALVYPLVRRSVTAALGLLAGFALFLAFSDRLLSESSSGNALGRLLGRGSAAGSDQAREGLADQAINQFQTHPVLGVGLSDVLAAHVIYLQIAAALGAIGLVFFLLVIWTVVRPAVLLNPPFNLLALPAMAYATLGLVTPVLWDRYIWAVLALSLLAPRLAIETPPDDQPSAEPEVSTLRTRAGTTSEFA